MSLGEAGVARPGGGFAKRLLIAALAVLAVGATLYLISLLAAGGAPAPPPRPARNPFGVGAAPPVSAPGGLMGWIMAVQADFYRQLTGAVRAAKESGAAATALMTVSFLYGVFHAAGPGHGKAVIAGYIVASERALRRGVGLSFAAALVQALVAIGIVTVFAIGLNATAARMREAERWVEMTSFAAVALIGAALLWRKAGRLAGLAFPGAAGATSAGGPGHFHLPAAEVVERAGSLRELAGVALAAGVRPCSGAIIVLVFAYAQGLFGAGVAAVLAMGLGTALTTSALAILAVAAKRAALAFAAGRGRATLLAGATLEALAAAFVLILGVELATGYWLAAGGS